VAQVTAAEISDNAPNTTSEATSGPCWLNRN